MNALCVFFLTEDSVRGYLCPLSPLPRMERDSLPSRPLPSSEVTPSRTTAVRFNEGRSFSRLARLARSTRGRVGAALLAFGGGATMAEHEADAATILQGQVVENVFDKQPQRMLALDNFDATSYRITTADGASDEAAKWFAFELSDEMIDQGYAVDAYIEPWPNPPSSVVAPDQVFGGIRTKYFMVLADLPEFTSVQYGIGVNNGSAATSLDLALRNAPVYAGFGNMTGTPTTLEEGMEMTEYVMVGQYPANVSNDSAWVFAQTETPEPSSIYLAGAGIAAGALASRRRARNVLKPVA